MKLVFLDVDGTLVGPQGVPECAWEAIEEAKAQGLRLSLVTGRPGRGEALRYARRLDPEGLHIFESGAVVLALGQDPHEPPAHPFHVEALPEKAAQETVRLARRLGLLLEAYTADGGFFVEGADPVLEAHQALLDLKAEEANLLSLTGLVRLQILLRPEDPLKAFLEGLPKDLAFHLAESPKMPGVRFLSLTKGGVSKRTAAERVARAYGLSLREAAMVGDGENDLELIRAVGLGVAMGNAPLAVQKAARWVAPPVEACGLAEALRRIGGRIP
ncbi:HAD family hydrolase [Thermus sp.]|uniref:HAD family hydrolase n=1 Tax=Thermus sp. TaxID=275 RepID=UPI00307EFBEB